MREVSGWTDTDSRNNSLATASRAAEVDKVHYLSGVIASYETAVTGLLQIKEGTTVILAYYIHNSDHLIFSHPIRIAENTEVSAELAASGTAGVLNKVGIFGYTASG